MQYDAKSPQEYLSLLDDDWRKEAILSIRELILKHDNQLDEGINYKMLGYSDDRGFAMHLNAQKNYIGLYVGDIQKIDIDGSLLKGIDCGKGCVRIKKKNLTQLENLDEFICKAIDLWKKGVDIDC